MNRLLTLSLLTASFLSAQTKPAPVPASYQDLYNSLSTQINTYKNAVHSNWSGTTSPVLYAPQLIGASSVQYTQLLAPGYYQNYVLPQLMELEALGAKGVTVHINFPILYQPFYASNPSQYQQFVDFYQQLAIEIHSRGMKLVVESTVGSAFPGDNVASFSTFMKGLSWNAYMAGRVQNALEVAQQVQPDYMSVITEPDTEASSSGQPNAGTLAGSTQLLKSILSTLQSNGMSHIPVGAGVGTWMPSFLQFIQSYAATSVSYVDMHLYPINKNCFLNTITAANLIHAAGKQAAISEAWMYKLRDSEVDKLSYTDVYARDPYSFWAPLDTAFLNAVSDFANAKNLLFVGPFWSHYLSSYVDYNSNSAMASTAVMNASYTAARTANLAGAFTSTGLAWMNRIIPAPDSSAPYIPAAPSATAVTNNTVYLAWTPTSDNVGVAAYRVYRNGSLIGTTSMMGFIDQGLTAGTSYNYTISAFDATGNVSPQSAQLKVKTVSAPAKH